jgi:hypothetical protein
MAGLTGREESTHGWGDAWTIYDYWDDKPEEGGMMLRTLMFET